MKKTIAVLFMVSLSMLMLFTSCGTPSWTNYHYTSQMDNEIWMQIKGVDVDHLGNGTVYTQNYTFETLHFSNGYITVYSWESEDALFNGIDGQNGECEAAAPYDVIDDYTVQISEGEYAGNTISIVETKMIGDMPIIITQQQDGNNGKSISNNTWWIPAKCVDYSIAPERFERPFSCCNKTKKFFRYTLSASYDYGADISEERPFDKSQGDGTGHVHLDPIG